MKDHDQIAHELEWGLSPEERKVALQFLTNDCDEMEFVATINAFHRSQAGAGGPGDRFRALRYLAENTNPYFSRLVLELLRNDDEAEFQLQAVIRERDNPKVHEKKIQAAKQREHFRIQSRNEQLAIRVIEAKKKGLSLSEAISRVASGLDLSEVPNSTRKPRVFGEETVRKAYHSTLRVGQNRKFLMKLKNDGYPMYERVPVPQVVRGRPKKR